MSHEAVVYGVIVGTSLPSRMGLRKLQEINVETIESLPVDEDWPWVDRSIFALPGPYPQGTFRRQIIHLGMTIKDDSYDERSTLWDEWLTKFEGVLRKLYWTSARVHVETDFAPRRELTWIPTEKADQAMRWADPPLPVSEWIRSERSLEGAKLRGT